MEAIKWKDSGIFVCILITSDNECNSQKYKESWLNRLSRSPKKGARSRSDNKLQSLKLFQDKCIQFSWKFTTILKFYAISMRSDLKQIAFD